MANKWIMNWINSRGKTQQKLYILNFLAFVRLFVAYSVKRTPQTRIGIWLFLIWSKFKLNRNECGFNFLVCVLLRYLIYALHFPENKETICVPLCVFFTSFTMNFRHFDQNHDIFCSCQWFLFNFSLFVFVFTNMKIVFVCFHSFAALKTKIVFIIQIIVEQRVLICAYEWKAKEKSSLK